MSLAMATQVDDTDLTLRLAENSAGLTFDAVPADVVEVARHCLLDWIGVTLAGSTEPLSNILTEQAREEGGKAQATIIGHGDKLSVMQAALINGATSHALDYDDVHKVMNGHPSVPVIPAILALAERDGRNGRDFITAMVAGIEAECRVAALVNLSHYDKGWHLTGTAGAFGAAAAAAKMLGLNGEATANAMGIAGTQAAGLKSMFGTMCKPFHAGKAAANGLYAALLGAKGFESRTDVLECQQGFADTSTDNYDPAAALDGLGTLFHTRNVLFKYHAACYGTHAAIEATSDLKRRHNIDPANVDKIQIGVRDSLLKMCNIQEPVTGLEGKFSLRMTAAMALQGENTGVIANYNENTMKAPELVQSRDRITVVENNDCGIFEADVVVSMKDGTVFRERGNVETPAADLDWQWNRLVQKFEDMAGPVIGPAKADQIIAAVKNVADADSLHGLVDLCKA